MKPIENRLSNIKKEKKDTFLFEQSYFKNVGSSEEFIQAMPARWHAYPIQKLAWPLEWIERQAQEFWFYYSGAAPDKRDLSKLKRRMHWYSVWVAWCDQSHRQPR